jgi:multidrug resistance efflux pump
MSGPTQGSAPGGSAPAGDPADGSTATATEPAAPDKPTGRRPLKRSTRVALLVILVVALIAAGAFTASYVLDARNYVSTDNAQVDGDRISVNAPTSGTLIDWRATQGA